MPSQPKIHLVRHAQGFHNLGSEFHSLPDPRLTPLGESQCLTLQEQHFPSERQQSISLIAASPLSRTLHTAFLTFSPALTNGVCKPTILALPDAQETSDYPCDTGSDVPVLEAICAEHGWPADLSLLTEDWNVKTLSNRYSPASDAIAARARDTRLLLRQKARELTRTQDDVEIVLVAHGGYLHYLTDDWEDADKLSGTGWENTEYRTYEFEADWTSDAADADAFLVETAESRTRRGKTHPMPGRERQAELFRLMMQGWEDQGLQNPSKLKAPADEDLPVTRVVSEVKVVA